MKINWDQAAEKTPDDISREQAELTTAKLYLADTAWYVMRNLETAAPIPDEIKAKRAAAYEVLNNATA